LGIFYHHIVDALNLDFTDPDFEDMVLELNKDKTYIIYCKSGKRGAKVMDKFKELGFTKVYNIIGGFEAWKKKF